MKYKKILFSIILAVLLALSSVSCDDDSSETEEIAETTAAREMISLEGYTFVYPATAPREVIAAVKTAADTLNASFGLKLTHTNDWMAIAPEEPVQNEEKEILLGATNRAESAKAQKNTAGNYTFSVTQTGSKIVIYGGSEEAILRGLEHFLGLITAEGAASIEKDYTFTKNYVDEAVSADSVPARLASEYEIIFPVISNSGEKAIAEEIANQLFSKTDIAPKRRSDNSAGKDKEILIGFTSRTPAEIKCGYFDYSIKVSGNKIYVVGGCGAAIQAAGKKLVEIAFSEELKLDSDAEYSYSILKASEMNPIASDISLFTPFWAKNYTPPAWMLDFNEKTYAVTCPDGRITIKAHRGDSDNYPDNSLEGIASAILAGADCVEFDTQLTLDGIAVLLHDTSLAKATDAASYVGRTGYPQTLSVNDWTFEQLRVLKMTDDKGNLTEYKVATLYEALKLCAGRVFVQVDDKSGNLQIESAEIYNLARETGSEECFFYYYGVSLLNKWLAIDPENKELADYVNLCRKYLSISGHSLRKPYWTNEVNKYDGGKFSETEDWWKKLSSQGKLMIWSQNVWKLSKYVSEHYTAETPE